MEMTAVSIHFLYALNGARGAAYTAEIRPGRSAFTPDARYNTPFRPNSRTFLDRLDGRHVRIQCLLIVAFSLCSGIAGCFSDDTPVGKGGPADLPFAGQKIGLSVPAGLSFGLNWEGPLKEWQAQTGATATLTEYDVSEPSQTAGRFSATSDCTLLVFPLEHLGDLLDTGALAPLPQAVLSDSEGVNWIDIQPGLRDGLASPRKKPTIVPVSCPVLVCYYRRDLLEKAGLAPPRTWDDYQKLLETLADWAPGLTAVEPWGGDFRATMFLARSLAHARHPGHYSLFFDIETGAPLIDGQGFVRALEVAQRAWARLSPLSRDFGPAECRNALLQHQAALAIAFEPTAGAESAAGERNADGRIGFCRLPGSREAYNPTRKVWEPLADKGINQPVLVGFTGYACAASAHRSLFESEAAWNAVARLGSQGFVSGFPAGVVSLCRESQVVQRQGLTGPELQADEAQAYLETVAESLRDSRQVIELPVVRRAEFRQALAQALTPALEGREPPAAALKSAATAWKRLVDEIGPQRLRDGYRAALGLSAASPVN